MSINQSIYYLALRVISSLLVVDNKVGQRLVLSPEDDSSNEMGQDSAGLVFTVGGGRNREYSVEFFECEQLCLWDKEPDQNERDNVKCRVCTESTLRSESPEHSGELGISNVHISKKEGHTVKDRIDEKPRQTATDHAIPCSRWARGNTSAEYMKGTGPSPTE